MKTEKKIAVENTEGTEGRRKDNDADRERRRMEAMEGPQEGQDSDYDNDINAQSGFNASDFLRGKKMDETTIMNDTEKEQCVSKSKGQHFIEAYVSLENQMKNASEEAARMKRSVHSVSQLLRSFVDIMKLKI